jgi:glycosyltransferase involved in cell wall biosynthesis
LFKGYVVNRIPDDFRTHVTEELFRYLCALIESRDLRVELGSAARDVARTKFSLEQRNRRMVAIYEAAMA